VLECEVINVIQVHQILCIWQ